MEKNLFQVDHLLIWLTRILIISLPLMLINPMDPTFHRLQLTEFIFFPVILLLIWQLISGNIPLKPPNTLFFTATIFIVICYIGAVAGINPKTSILESTKLLYLFSLASTIYIVGNHYQQRESFWRCLGLGYFIVLLGGILGIFTLLFNMNSFLAYKSKIIPIALNIQEWVPYLPRVTSFLQPTANMLGSYLAITTLPILTLYFRKPFFKKNPWITLLTLFFIIFLGFLTMSRTFIGILLSICFGLICFDWQIMWKKFWTCIICVTAIIAWIILLFFSTLYPVHLKAYYSHETNYKKEMVNLKGNKIRKNPVYFFRKGVGLEKIHLELDYGINHYAWLKYAAWRLFKLYPILGVGIGNYSLGMQQLFKENIIEKQLSQYRSAQSQYATLLAETGIFGLLTFLLLLSMLIFNFVSRYRASQDRLSFAVALSLTLLILIAINIDVLSFRWLWGLIGVALLPASEVS